MLRVLKISLIYFAIVFGVGFILGMFRVPFLVPALGEQVAELIELPLMLVAIYLAALWITDRYALINRMIPSIFVGVIATMLLVAVEFSVVLWIRGMTFEDFMASRDPIAATVYYCAVAIFALMPAFLSLMSRGAKNE